MKLESSLDRRPALLHLVPLLDVVTILVIFFLLGTTFVHQTGVAVELPFLPSSLPRIDEAHMLLITRGPDHQVFFDRQLMTVETLLEDHLTRSPDDPKETVIFQADKQASHGLVMRISNAALEGGFNVIFATDATRMEEAPSTP